MRGMSNTKERWAPWPEKRFAKTYEVSSRGRARTVARVRRDKNGKKRQYRSRLLTIHPDLAVTVGRTRRSVPKAVLLAFGKLPVRWR